MSATTAGYTRRSALVVRPGIGGVGATGSALRAGGAARAFPLMIQLRVSRTVSSGGRGTSLAAVVGPPLRTGGTGRGPPPWDDPACVPEAGPGLLSTPLGEVRGRGRHDGSQAALHSDIRR